MSVATNYGPLFAAKSRPSDAGTAAKAASAVNDSHAAQGIAALVLRCLDRCGPCTSDEAAERIGRPYASVAPRFAPLERSGLIRRTGHERQSLTSTAMRQVYEITSEGKERVNGQGSLQQVAAE